MTASAQQRPAPAETAEVERTPARTPEETPELTVEQVIEKIAALTSEEALAKSDHTHQDGRQTVTIEMSPEVYQQLLERMPPVSADPTLPPIQEGVTCLKRCPECGKCILREPFEIYTKNAAVSVIG